MLEKFAKGLMWVGIALLIPLAVAVWWVFVAAFVVILFCALSFFIVTYITGRPVPVTKDGKRIGVLVRGTFYPD